MKKFVFLTVLGSVIFILIGLALVYKDTSLQIFDQVVRRANLLLGRVPDRFEDPEAYEKWIVDIDGDIFLLNRLKNSDFETYETERYKFYKPLSWKSDAVSSNFQRFVSPDGGEFSIYTTDYFKKTETVTLADGTLNQIDLVELKNPAQIASNMNFDNFAGINTFFVDQVLRSDNEGKQYNFYSSYDYLDRSDIRVYRFIEKFKNESGVFDSNMYSNFTVVYLIEKENKILVLDFKFPSPDDLLDDKNDVVSRNFNIIDERFEIK